MTRVLPPEMTFDALVRLLSDQGWKSVPVPGLLPPLIAGEPEQARFERAAESVTYSFNPVVRLRMLQGDTDSAQPCVRDSDVAAWLGSDNPRARARGCVAASELGLGHLLPTVKMVSADLPTPLKPMAEAAIRRLTPLPAGSATATFDALPAGLKPGILRQLAHDNPASAAKLLPKCWTDGPELALSAMVLAARLKRADQTLNIRRLDLEGLTRGRLMGQMFRAAKMACLATLEGKGPGSDDSPRNRFWRLVLGQHLEVSDAGFFMDAVSLPMPELPDHSDEAYARVASIEHRIGHSAGRGLENAAQIWAPQEFEIARSVMMNDDTQHPVVTRNPSRAVTSGQNEGLRLPTSREWEAAMRGPDGRFHCWGMTAIKPVVPTSPWGLTWSGRPEWTVHQGNWAISGSDPSGRVSYVRPPKPDEAAAIRWVVSDK